MALTLTLTPNYYHIAYILIFIVIILILYNVYIRNRLNPNKESFTIADITDILTKIESNNLQVPIESKQIMDLSKISLITNIADMKKNELLINDLESNLKNIKKQMSLHTSSL
jgi:hypothetical protein